jgi:hypothetical protein
MSLTYELNGHDGRSVSKSDIGLIIGAKARGIKGVISNSWTMYEAVQKSSKRVEEEKPKVRIILKDHEDGVQAEIISESENMRKLAQLSLTKHIRKIQQSSTLKSHEFLVEYPHHLLGKLIGKKAQNLTRLLTDAKFEGKGKDRKILIHKDDLETANTARIQVNELTFDGTKELLQYSKHGGSRIFIGWPPEEEDEYEEHISLKITFKHGSKPLNDRDQFIERLNDVISDRVTQIKSEDDDQMDEINECLGFESD